MDWIDRIIKDVNNQDAMSTRAYLDIIKKQVYDMLDCYLEDGCDREEACVLGEATLEAVADIVDLPLEKMWYFYIERWEEKGGV